MKYLLLAVCLSFTVTGCYTMLHPPVNELVAEYSAGDSVLTVQDSVSGNNITIINQNQLIFDRYYQDPYYQRGGYWGATRYWDPYYYNPHRYHRVNYWHHGRYQSGSSSGTSTPKVKKPRRKKDYRESNVPPNNSPESTEYVNVQAPAPTAISAKPEPKKITVPQNTDRDDNQRTLRTVSAPSAPDTEEQPDSTKDQNDGKTQRRGNSRER